jgi:hypothetical protein
MGAAAHLHGERHQGWVVHASPWQKKMYAVGWVGIL